MNDRFALNCTNHENQIAPIEIRYEYDFSNNKMLRIHVNLKKKIEEFRMKIGCHVGYNTPVVYLFQNKQL